MGTAVFSPSHACHKPALPFPNICNSHHGLLLLPNFHAHHRLANARKKRILLQAFKVKCRNEGNFDKESINREATNESRANNFMRFAEVSRSGGRTQNRLENKLVFVAGATGRVGSRTVRELLKLGYNVRAGTRDVEKAQNMFKPTFFTPVQEKQLQIVECDLENPETIEPALGNASMVVCCIGASERDSLNVTGPYRIDFKATENLINKAADAQVNHFVLLTSLGTGKIGFPAAVLNLFWGVLLWKGKAEQALIHSGIPYTIVRPGGMERPTDMYKETHNLVLAGADTLFGGQVSNLQVAELVASIVANPDISKNKVLEVVAETKAPFRSIEELLAEIPDDGSKESKFLSRSRGQSTYKDFGNGKIEKLEEKNSKDRLQDQNMEQDKMKKEVLRIKDQREIKAAIEKEKNAQKAVEEAIKGKEELERRSAELRTQARVADLSLRQAKDVEAAAEKGKVFKDLKPPSTPCPNPPNTFSSPWQKRKHTPIRMEPPKDLSVEPTFEANSTQYPVVSSETGLLTSQRPLSPYFMFLGLKPPLSPMSSLPRLEECQIRSYIQENQAITIKEEGNSGNVVEDKETIEHKSSQQLSVHQISDKTIRERESLEKAKAVTGVSSISEMFINSNSGAEHQSQTLTAMSIRLSADIIPDENQNKNSTQSLRPLSPYFAFKDLKPPSTPCPNPPNAQLKIIIQETAMPTLEKKMEPHTNYFAESKTGNDSEKDISIQCRSKQEEWKLLVEEIALREKEAVEKARKANTFSWPWQKRKRSPILMEPQKDLAVEPTFEANSIQYPVVSSETGLFTSQRPLSPYFMFLGLKPPLSPMASPPRLEECQLRSYIQENQAITRKEEHNSGNVVEDKEPMEQKSSQQISVHQISDTTRRERESLEKAKAVTGVSSISDMFINSNSGSEHQSQPLTALSIRLSSDIIPDENQNKGSTQSNRPLSPYFAYPDLRPPCSPTPCPPKLI